LRPSQAADLQSADLIIWIGPEMTPWLDRSIAGLSAGTPQLRLLEVTGTHLQDFTGEPAATDDHDHTSTDPHAWLDPSNAVVWLDLIAADLSRHDPANAATYAANAAAGRSAVAAADVAAQTILAPVRDRPFVVFHDAYGYFVSHYGLTVAGTISLGDAAAPGAAQLSALHDGLAGGADLCIFPEANHDPKLVVQLAEGSGARVGGALDPEGSLLDPGPGLYRALLTGLATTIADCLVSGP
jgi:zinc transport system substrate-binding protein